MALTVTHAGPAEVLLALARVEARDPLAAELPAELVTELDALLARRREGSLDEPSERRRRASRDMLRQGRYKPTGRGKPASEYLLRAAIQADFPRVSGAVDLINLVSLRWMAPASVFDLDRCNGLDSFLLRLGQQDERYVFNPAGQTLELEDLLCLCARAGVDPGRPVVTPIKDCQATKTSPGCRRVAACAYLPAATFDLDGAAEVATELLDGLARCAPGKGDGASLGQAVLRPGATVTL